MRNNCIHCDFPFSIFDDRSTENDDVCNECMRFKPDYISNKQASLYLRMKKEKYHA